MDVTMLHCHEICETSSQTFAARNLRFFADCAAKKWPLRGSRQPSAISRNAVALAGAKAVRLHRYGGRTQ